MSFKASDNFLGVSEGKKFFTAYSRIRENLTFHIKKEQKNETHPNIEEKREGKKKLLCRGFSKVENILHSERKTVPDETISALYEKNPKISHYLARS